MAWVWYKTREQQVYLQYMPVYEQAIIFGAKWLRTEWKPSKQLVRALGEACLIPFTKALFVKAAYTGKCTLTLIR